ncbi:hypothetical protein PRUPE_1G119300 [Prunus persica]|uniref:Uncharacterized protein n=1 Tax=Prunus persica TaxID=3760 RepID=A0A251QWH0_PRUPE|nr:hypothetical protein PRUPE_1G119300 [Prunus persica]
MIVWFVFGRRIDSLSYFVEIEMQSGVDTSQDLISAYEISPIHHSDIRRHFRSICALLRFRRFFCLEASASLKMKRRRLDV